MTLTFFISLFIFIYLSVDLGGGRRGVGRGNRKRYASDAAIGLYILSLIESAIRFLVLP